MNVTNTYVTTVNRHTENQTPDDFALCPPHTLASSIAVIFNSHRKNREPGEDPELDLIIRVICGNIDNALSLVNVCIVNCWHRALADVLFFNDPSFPAEYSCHLGVLNPWWVRFYDPSKIEKITLTLLDHNFSYAGSIYDVASHDTRHRISALYNAGVRVRDPSDMPCRKWGYASLFAVFVYKSVNLKHITQTPRSLQHECKIVIRSSIGPCDRSDLLERVDALSLPQLIKAYVFEKF